MPNITFAYVFSDTVTVNFWVFHEKEIPLLDYRESADASNNTRE